MSGRMDWEKANRQGATRPNFTAPGKPNAFPATKAQERYIASLALRLGIPMPEFVTRSGASATIRNLKQRLHRKATATAGQQGRGSNPVNRPRASSSGAAMSGQTVANREVDVE